MSVRKQASPLLHEVLLSCVMNEADSIARGIRYDQSTTGRQNQLSGDYAIFLDLFFQVERDRILQFYQRERAQGIGEPQENSQGQLLVVRILALDALQGLVVGLLHGVLAFRQSLQSLAHCLRAEFGR